MGTPPDQRKKIQYALLEKTRQDTNDFLASVLSMLKERVTSKINLASRHPAPQPLRKAAETAETEEERRDQQLMSIARRCPQNDFVAIVQGQRTKREELLDRAAIAADMMRVQSWTGLYNKGLAEGLKSAEAKTVADEDEKTTKIKKLRDDATQEKTKVQNLYDKLRNDARRLLKQRPSLPAGYLLSIWETANNRTKSGVPADEPAEAAMV